MHVAVVTIPPCPGQLRDNGRSVGEHFRYRRADIIQRRYFLEPRIGKVSAGDLWAAFEKVRNRCSGAEYLPFAFSPTEPVAHTG